MSRKHGWGAARPLKQGSGNYCTVFDAHFHFQFSRDIVGPLCSRCSADPACPYPAIEGELCRAHYYDRFSVLSLTRINSGHSWIRHHTKLAEIHELIDFWRNWLKEFKSKSTFIYSMSGVTGLDHPQAKLSDEEVQQIRRELKAKENYTGIAEKYGVSTSLISMIAKGRGYRGAEGDLGWTSQDRSECSKRVAADKWEKWRAANKDIIEHRMKTVHSLRQNGVSWREIGRKMGMAYQGLGEQYRKHYNIEPMTKSQAGRLRARRPTYQCNPV